MAAKENPAPGGNPGHGARQKSHYSNHATGGGESQVIPFIKFLRTPESFDILKNPNALSLLALIALRARRTSSIIYGLEPGEALIGDYKSCGLTEQKYRTAKKNLEKWEIITTRATNKGTIAKLINTDVFDVNSEPDNGQVNETITTDQRTGNDRVTTNKNVRKKECNNLSTEIFQLFIDKVQPAQRTKSRALSNIGHHLKKHTPDDLKQSIRNYATVALTREPQYRKDPANFFGKQESAFVDYLPENFEPPATARPVEQEPLEEVLR